MLDALGAPPLPRSRGRSLLPLIGAPGGSGRPSDRAAVDWEDVAFVEHCTDFTCESAHIAAIQAYGSERRAQ